jgi:asparagine synthase (glutamine-hydrolysing)
MPLLDHRLVELAFTLPAAIKLRRGRSKWPLRHVLDKYVPRALIDRPKHGFGIPLANWLRGPLRGWADDLLSRDSLVAAGLVDAARVGRLWGEHRGGLRDHGPLLWKVLMLQSWHILHRA